MFTRLICSRSRPLYYVQSNINNTVRTCSQYITKKEGKTIDSTAKVAHSKKFPGYQTIYFFPNIKYLCLINRLMRTNLFLCGIGIPLTQALFLMDIVSSDIPISASLIGAALMFNLGGLGLIFRNFIGAVYLKADEEKVILSYMNIWGKRTDLHTTVENIEPIERLKNIKNFWYKSITITDPKIVLKINADYGEVLDAANLEYIIGNTD